MENATTMLTRRSVY